MIKTQIEPHDIVIMGAKTNTLKNITVVIPAGKLTVITGLSGSGKSSLAFQTLYAEGQNRFVECLGTYARQFIESQARPDVEEIRNIRPAIAIKQENRVRSSRSTVGTSTEILDYLRIFFARVGKTHCTSCGEEVREHTQKDVFTFMESIQEGEKIAILFPAEASGYSLTELQGLGFQRMIMDGKEVLLTSIKEKEAKKAHVVYERMSYTKENERRLAEAVVAAFHYGKGLMSVWEYSSGKQSSFSDQFRCDTCQILYQKPQPAFFSFNSPLGACRACEGSGDVAVWDEKKVILDPKKSVLAGAIDLLQKPSMERARMKFFRTWEASNMPMHDPYESLAPVWKEKIWKAVEEVFAYLEKKKYKMHVRVFLSKYRAYVPCKICDGSRLQPATNAVTLAGNTFIECSQMDIKKLTQFLREISLSTYDMSVSQSLREDLVARLDTVIQVGLGYLTLDREANTLSGGESQRLRLAGALRSGLSDVLYVLDEPTIGLHPTNTAELLTILLQLRDLGNTVVVVEHEEEVMKKADYIIDMGPGAGEQGGEVIFQGTWEELVHAKNSLTAQYLLKEKIITRNHFQEKEHDFFRLKNIQKFNLKNIDVSFPVGKLSTIVGVSGCGKSTLMDELYRHFSEGAFGEKKVELIDQEPIGKSSRSVPVTYLGFFDPIRALFAATPDAKKMKLTPGHFSFNSKLGQCPHCDGHGERVEEMYFLNDMVIPCEFCNGKRYKEKVLKITYGFRTIADVLDMTVTQAKIFFAGHKKIETALDLLIRVGLGYVRLGQSAMTFSGGEAQRFKIAAALMTYARASQKDVVYLMDEPTTGLHFADIQVLLDVCSSMVEQGATIIMVEHNVDMIRNSDWIVELGPEAGEKGGRVMYEGCGELFMK